MTRIATICVLGGVVFLTGLAGCKTEVNNPPPQGTTVIREDRSAPDRVDVHVHDRDKPDVQNNIRVDR